MPLTAWRTRDRHSLKCTDKYMACEFGNLQLPKGATVGAAVPMLPHYLREIDDVRSGRGRH